MTDILDENDSNPDWKKMVEIKNHSPKEVELLLSKLKSHQPPLSLAEITVDRCLHELSNVCQVLFPLIKKLDQKKINQFEFSAKVSPLKERLERQILELRKVSAIGQIATQSASTPKKQVD